MKHDIRKWWKELSQDWKHVLFENTFGDILFYFEERLSSNKIEELNTRDKNTFSWRSGGDYSEVLSRLTLIEIAIILNLQELHLGDGDYLLTDYRPINYLIKLRRVDILYHEIALEKLELPLLQEITFIYPYFNDKSLTLFHEINPNVILKIW